MKVIKCGVKLKQKTFERIVVILMIGVLSLSFIMNGFAVVSEEDVKVGAYYYTWWGIPFNNHWDHGIKYTPFLGEYNSSDPVTADRHILWAKQHGIDFFAVSWLGEGGWIKWWDFDDIDQNLKNGFLSAPHLRNFSFCLFYETKIVLDTANQESENFTEIFINDIVYVAENYFSNPSYLRVNGQPVLFIYNLPYLYQNLSIPKTQRLFDVVRQQLASMDVNVYLAGDLGGGPSPPDTDSPLLHSMNATTSYFFSDASKGWQEILKDAETYYPIWRSVMNSKRISFIPNAYPGFEASQGTVLLLNENMFKKMLNIAFNYADNDLKTVMITSWNEWLESTAIEPSMEFGELFLHMVLEAKSQHHPIIWNVIYFLVGVVSGVIATIISYYLKTFRKRKEGKRTAYELKKESNIFLEKGEA